MQYYLFKCEALSHSWCVPTSMNKIDSSKPFESCLRIQITMRNSFKTLAIYNYYQKVFTFIELFKYNKLYNYQIN